MDYDHIPKTILSLAEKFPDRTAYIFEDRKISCGELSRRASALACFLGAGKPVVLYGHKDPCMIIGMLACLICARTYVPCDISFPAGRLRSAVAQSGADTVICADGSSGTADIFGTGVRIITQDDIYALPLKTCECAKSGDNAYIVFTSGSTGEPKGIIISRSNLQSFLSYALSFECLCSGKCVGGHGLFSFDLSVADIYLSLMTGRTHISFDKLISPDCETVICTPTFLKMCLLGKKLCPENYPKLKTVLCCGEVLPVYIAKKLLQRFENISLINAYGPAECCCFVSAYEITGRNFSDNAFPQGLPIGIMEHTASEISLSDGEIFICGKSVGAGYTDGIRGGFRDSGFYSGDGGFIENGLLYFNGRLRSGMIKYSGYRIETGEIEAALCSINGINACAVSADDDGCGQAALIRAYIVSDNGLCVEDIKHKLSEMLPQYMIPKIIQRVDELPVSLNGKFSDDQTGKQGDN